VGSADSITPTTSLIKGTIRWITALQTIINACD